MSLNDEIRARKIEESRIENQRKAYQKERKKDSKIICKTIKKKIGRHGFFVKLTDSNEIIISRNEWEILLGIIHGGRHENYSVHRGEAAGLFLQESPHIVGSKEWLFDGLDKVIVQYGHEDYFTKYLWLIIFCFVLIFSLLIF